LSHRKGRLVQSLLLMAVFLSFSELLAQVAPDKTAEAAKLSLILQKTAEYCRKLENAVLDFVCLEEVKETLYYEDIERQFNTGFYQVFNRAKESIFLYEYQLIGNAEKIEESRTLIKKNGKKCREKASGVGTTRFRYEKVIYGPVDLLKLSQQAYFNYAIISEELLPENKAVIIEAVPKPSQQEYCPFGKILVRESDFAILKIEYDRRSIKSLYAENQDRKPGSHEQRFELTSEFDVEKNGIRFPSRLVFQESSIDQSGNKSVRARALITYRDYRFFSVEVEVDYK
jgi:hypothetical protein